MKINKHITLAKHIAAIVFIAGISVNCKTTKINGDSTETIVPLTPEEILPESEMKEADDANIAYENFLQTPESKAKIALMQQHYKEYEDAVAKKDNDAKQKAAIAHTKLKNELSLGPEAQQNFKSKYKLYEKISLRIEKEVTKAAMQRPNLSEKEKTELYKARIQPFYNKLTELRVKYSYDILDSKDPINKLVKSLTARQPYLQGRYDYSEDVQRALYEYPEGANVDEVEAE
jgi:hypothetical protein